MNFSILNTNFHFKNSSDNEDEFFANVIFNKVNVEFCINKKYFESEQVDWDFIQSFIIHFTTNFNFIFEKSKKISMYLYNEYGDKVENENKFKNDNCEFINQLLVELEKPPVLYPYPKSGIVYLVDNVFDSEFTYLNTSCIFTDYKKAYFVGVKASSIED